MGLAFGPNGNLFVADDGFADIYEYTPSGIQSVFASGLSNPDFIAVVPEPGLRDTAH